MKENIDIIKKEKKNFSVFLHLTAKGVEKVGDRYKSNIFAVMGMYALLLPREC